MKIVADNRMPEIKRIEHLLYGLNYQVWLNVYGPLDPLIGLEKALKEGVSKEAVLSGVVPASPQEARSEIVGRILYEGDESHGPVNLDEKREEIVTLINRILDGINIDEADLVAGFGFRKGHPAYPVFWDFAYDIHSNGKRWIVVGSSSD